MILIACLPACLPIRQIIDYFAFPYASSLAHSKCSFIFIRSQARYRVPTRSVDLIITKLLAPLGICSLFHRGSCFFADVVQFLAFRSLTWFFADVCSVFAFRSLTWFLRRRLLSCSPFALRLGSSPTFVQFFALRSWTCFLSLRRRLFSTSIDHLYRILHACKRKNFFM
jgi:hypothetical protein